MSKLQIFTLNWNGEDKLKKLAPSLISALKNIDYTWWIKDNASIDKSIDYLKSLENPNINIIPYKDNRQNYSEGMNFLFKEANPNDNDYVLTLNNDTYIAKDNSLKLMMDIIQKNPDVGAVGSRLLYSGTNELQHAGVVFDKNALAPMHFRLKQKTDANAEKNRLFQVVTGAVTLTKAEYFRNVCTTNKSGINGFDEKFNWAFDDVDFCLSIHYNLNKKIVYCGSTTIYHEESASLKKNPSNKLFMSHNLNHLRLKWRDRFICDKEQYEKDVKYNLY